MEKVKKKPLYLQVKEKILEDMASSSFYSPLPGERELCENYNVSRPTIRRALRELENDNMIVTLHGKGSFYLGNRTFIYNSSHDGVTFYKSVISSGKYTKSKILVQNVVNAPAEVSEVLEIEKDSSVFHLKRLRYIDEELYSLNESYISYEICPNLLNYDYSERSLHSTLEEHDIKIYRAKRIIEIKPASFYEAMYLQLSEGDPISVARTISYDENGNIIELSIDMALAYKTRYEMEIYN